MKYTILKAMGAALGLAAVLATSTASAQVTTGEFPNRWHGSDTLNQVMDEILAEMKSTGDVIGGATGIDVYGGIGSTGGERQLEGSPSGTEPFCNPVDANGLPENNPGCQEVSPMSRAMASSVCEDDDAATNAEGLTICADGLVILTDNAGHMRYADSAAECPSPNPQTTPNPIVSGVPSFPDRATGSFRHSGTLQGGTYTIGGGTLGAGNEWKDVVRLVYTGCDNDDGGCATAIPRQTRCDSALRREVVGSWGNLFQGEDCGTGACPNGLRRAYRRDDSSGTTGVFLALINVNATTTTNLAGRSALYQGIVPAFVPVPSVFAFCDGGHSEGFFRDNAGPVGDPIRTACDVNEDLCGYDGTAPLVRAIRSTPETGAFPAVHCTRNAFASVPWANVALPVCPSGRAPKAGACRLPYFNNGGVKDFNCMSDRRSFDAQTGSGVDGRAYNWVARNSAGVRENDTPTLPVVAQWRENMTNLYWGISGIGFNGGPFPASDAQCQEDDATRQIGCLVSKTTCTIGYAGREGATTAPFDLTQEPVRLQGVGPSNANINDAVFEPGDYPYARALWVNALNGFENVTTDCLARITSPIPAGGYHEDFCTDQLAIARVFWDVAEYAEGGLVHTACTNAGYIPLDAPVCIGGQGSGTGCGRPASQPLSACEPL